MNIQNIIKSLTDLYKGKEFVRVSKYGRVHGIVDRIDTIDVFIMDEDTTKALISLKDKTTSINPNQEKTQLKYTASRPKFQVISTNGIRYNFDDCYFINKIL